MAPRGSEIEMSILSDQYEGGIEMDNEIKKSNKKGKKDMADLYSVE